MRQKDEVVEAAVLVEQEQLQHIQRAHHLLVEQVLQQELKLLPQQQEQDLEVFLVGLQVVVEQVHIQETLVVLAQDVQLTEILHQVKQTQVVVEEHLAQTVLKEIVALVEKEL